jgi:hypothetical protein
MANKPATYNAAAMGEVFQSVVAEVRAVYKQQTSGSTTLTAEDLRDLPSLASKLKMADDPVSIFLRGRLSAAARTILAGWPGSGAALAALQDVLLRDLNAIVAGELIYDPARFPANLLRPQTSHWLTQRQQRNTWPRLNRLLLEDAYPSELCQVSQIPSALVNAVDIELNFKSITISEKGLALFGKDSAQSHLEVRLATRITPPALAPASG